MPRTKGSKNKSKSKIINRNKNTNINNVHVHVEKTKTRRRRTTKPREELHSNPLSNSIGVSRPSSQNLGFHPRGLVDNAPQQPTIINIQPSADLEKLQKKLKKYKDKLNQNKEAQDTMNKEILTNITSTPQPKQAPINVTVNPFQPTVKQEKVTKEKLLTKKSIVRFPKSKTKSGTIFKPSELDETMSIASETPQKATPPPSPRPTPQPVDEEKLKREQKIKEDEKRLEARYYTLKGNEKKGGSIIATQIALISLKEQLQTATATKQQKSLRVRIEKKEETLTNLKKELQETEAKLKAIRAAKPRARGGILSAVSNFLSPAKV